MCLIWMLASSARDHPVLRDFLFGQYANLFKFALWWTSLAPLTYALLDSSTAVGIGRVVYNVTLCLLSPIGAIVAERFPARKLLSYSAITRLAVWCVLLPFLWSFLAGNSSAAYTVIYIGLTLMLAVDGVAVSMSNVLDIDVCGLDLVSSHYGIAVDDETRSYYNSRAELFFSLSFIVFTPLMAWGGLALQAAVDSAIPSLSHAAVESGTLAIVFFLTFGCCAILQLYFYQRMPASAPQPSDPPAEPPVRSKRSYSYTTSRPGALAQGLINPSEDDLAQRDNLSDDSPSEDYLFPRGFAKQVHSIPHDLAEAFGILLDHRAVMWRLIFLGMEIAVEDAVIVVVIGHCAVSLPWMGENDAVRGNVWCAMCVCCGKVGAAIGSYLMMKHFIAPTTMRGFWSLFGLVALGSLTAVGFPLSHVLLEDGDISANTARGVFLATCFLFFLVTTLPKIGFMCLLQTMVSSIENGHRVFGFIAIIATLLDAGVIMLLTTFFDIYSTSWALWLTVFFFAGHGLLELILGPWLVLGGGTKHLPPHANYKEEENSTLEFRKMPDSAIAAQDSQISASMRSFSPRPSDIGSSPAHPSQPSPRGSNKLLSDD